MKNEQLRLGFGTCRYCTFREKHLSGSSIFCFLNYANESLQDNGWTEMINDVDTNNECGLEITLVCTPEKLMRSENRRGKNWEKFLTIHSF